MDGGSQALGVGVRGAGRVSGPGDGISVWDDDTVLQMEGSDGRTTK